MRVLIAEQRRENALRLARLLKRWGCAVAFARSGAEALARARDFRPDLVLCSPDLPGPDGCALGARLQEESGCPSLPVVAMVASLSAGDALRQAGFTDQLVTPVEWEALTRILPRPQQSESRADARGDATEALAERFLLTDDPELRDQLETHFLPLFERLAERLVGKSSEQREDLMEAARMGLRAGVDSYAPDQPYSLLEHAVRCAVGAIKHVYRDRRWGGSEDPGRLPSDE